MTQPARPLYFDNHATTPVDPTVFAAMMPFFTEHFGNAESSQHSFGWKAKAAVEKARGEIAALLNAEPAEIIFTSGATESIHAAILGFLEEQAPVRHIITANTEHKATLEVCSRAKKYGHEVTVLKVDSLGRITPQQVRDAIQPNTALVSLMHGNNEIGTLHPIAEIGAITSEKGIAFHVDAAQTAGKIPIDVRAMNIDLLSISGHKLYGPKGTGALYIRRSAPRILMAPYIAGGGQERGLRGGTHNVPGIVGLGAACATANRVMAEECRRMEELRDYLITRIQHDLSDVILNGDPKHRLCNNVNFTIKGVAPDDLLLGLNDVAYSSGSACSSGTISHVLQAIHPTDQLLKDPMTVTVRFGIGRFNTREEVERLATRLVQAVQNARAVSQA